MVSATSTAAALAPPARSHEASAAGVTGCGTVAASCAETPAAGAKLPREPVAPNAAGTATAKSRASGGDVSLSDYDCTQAALMEETCIVVDEEDNVVGRESKKNCHLLSNIQLGLLHRAFSVFLFDSAGRLLLQQRAAEKITFPSMFTNTCCSHPLHFPEELEAEGQLGIRRAAQRKLHQELGIPPEQVPLDKLEFITRIRYCAESDGIWGEHEIDYILFFQADVTLNVNPNEVMSVRYVNPNELRAMFQDKTVLMTPWFKLIVENFLFEWWSRMMQGDLDSCKDVSSIHRL